ncbi:MAG: D-alanyl-D-alanine carboxypeptidase [Bdellovibrionaceae bacterium]|nr:D-alanyl-D-alanine carboxypeptidase [Pseudobdellovibrionaceae bacterium]
MKDTSTDGEAKMIPLHKCFLQAALICLLGAPAAQAARLGAFCTLTEANDLQGTNVERRLPIASVSKVVTALWSLEKGGADYRFKTTLQVTPVENDQVDLHIEGSRDPFFGRESLHFAISELNRRGIKKVRTLSFDENFKFYVQVTSDHTAASHYTTASPLPQTVLAQLKSMGSLTSGWSKTLQVAKATGTPLVEKARFSVEDIRFVPKSEAVSSSETVSFVMKSAPLLSLLKEMNRNSNNHAANQIFEHFGGAGHFRSFAAGSLGLGSRQIDMLNGSGDRVDLDSGAAYNEASCGTILRILRRLRSVLKSTGKDLQNVLAVAGGDNPSSVSKIYNNDVTQKSLIAKTGTVNPAITLAGLIRTLDGDVYFMYNIETKGTSADWRNARALIRQKITELIRDHNGGKPVKYSALQFMSVDDQSIFEGETIETDDLNHYVTDIPTPSPRPPIESLP